MAEPYPTGTEAPAAESPPSEPSAAPWRVLLGWPLNVALFGVTLYTTYYVGGLAYAAALMGILLAHEMGHYVTARIYRVETSLPYFIPLPFVIGTRGAVIRMDDRIPDRKSLVAIGAAGPLAGMVVAVPLLFYGLSLSTVAPAVPHMPPLTEESAWHILSLFIHGGGTAPVAGFMSEGNSILYWLAKHLVFHLGPGQDVWIHPVAWAAWIGLFVTALNMIPVGQLDGGHVVFGLFRDRAHPLNDVVRGILIGLGIAVWAGWLVWAILLTVILRLSGGRHPPVEKPELPMPRWAKVMSWTSLVVLVLTFSPAPLRPGMLSASEARALPPATKQVLGLCDPLIDWREKALAGKKVGPAPTCPKAPGG